MGVPRLGELRRQRPYQLRAPGVLVGEPGMRQMPGQLVSRRHPPVLTVEEVVAGERRPQLRHPGHATGCRRQPVVPTDQYRHATRSTSASTCWVIRRRDRQYATRRPIGSSPLSTPPPPHRDGPGCLLHRYAIRLGLREKSALRRILLGRLDLLAPALRRRAVLTTHPYLHP
ncbi:hypothetical protein [Micromonospora echinofusca]|uniref:hypothetical protein n=1 Tax=Micromonospora echinofusca TaxID=47858 RepID=UPI001FCB9043|nr:hypothetical protein [Micromonospora echinofusca]